MVAPATLKPCSTAAPKVGPVERLEADLHRDARAKRLVLLQVQPLDERRQAHQPHGHQLAAVEGEVEKARQVRQERVGEHLRLVEHDDGRHAALVDHVHQGPLDVGPELAAPVRGGHAQLPGDRPVQVERRARGVAQVQHVVVGASQLAGQVADRAGLADARLAPEHADGVVLDGLAEGPAQPAVARALVVEGLALGVLGQGVVRHLEACLVAACGHGMSSLSLSSSSSLKCTSRLAHACSSTSCASGSMPVGSTPGAGSPVMRRRSRWALAIRSSGTVSQ